ncbi:unnamed protein product [Ilex paraguariensis]|uniref:Symplekin/Pta1 N-terminal domain-containing protein n=1 Tax=Ilex paraguariensis TaxID=185542 RepID=A0ABC8QNB6_9AQUA
MVGITAANSREKVASLISAVKFDKDIPSKLDHLRQLKDELSDADTVLLSEFLSPLLDLHTDSFSPVRKFIIEIIGHIGLKHVELLPEIVPVLIIVLRDGTPAVARQAITCGIDLFRCTLIRVAIQGLYKSELDDILVTSWSWVLKFRDEIYSLAFHPGIDGRRLLALKFIVAVIFLYTPDPTGPSEPPTDQTFEGMFEQFNMSWLRGGHPLLNIGDLSTEASQSLGLLLNQLRFPTGLYKSELDDILVTSWSWVLKFRDEIYSLAFHKPGIDGRRLLALKFIVAVIFLYTPDPTGPSEPPTDQTFEGMFEQFNMSWLRGGHPLLNIGDLSTEASQSLGLLLNQLRFPTVKSLSNLMIIVLINSLSAIAKKRPAFYGRILPVLLGLDLSSTVSKGLHVSGVHHALKNAFLSCLNCTHPGAAPWRDRLVGALKELKIGGLTEEAFQQLFQTNGRVEWKDDISTTQEEQPLAKAYDAVHINAGRKRSGVHDNSDLVEEDDVSGKRVKPTPIVSEASSEELTRDQDGVPSSGLATSRGDGSGLATSRGDGHNGTVQQLVAMFGALVAQGEKAVGHLEILISSISADFLAEVVMANMRNLPPNRPTAEGDEDPQLNLSSYPGLVGSDAHFKHLSSLLTDILSQSIAFPQVGYSLNAQQSTSNELEQPEGEEEHPMVTLVEGDVARSDLNYAAAAEQALVPAGVSGSSSEDVASVMEDGCSIIPSEVVDVGNLESEIPGLVTSSRSDGLSETLIVSTDLEDASQEQVSSLGRSPLQLLPSISTDRSEELSPKAAVSDMTSINSSMTASVGLSTQLVLPKMSAPIVDLTDEEKDQLQKMAFMRIIEAYKQVEVAGGSDVRFSILADLGAEFPLDLDPWKLLQTHILSDYINHEGHELTLRVLYRLFGEAEEDRDFFSSTTATSAYEMFLQAVAETLRDSFPASDKSLSKLLGEVPYLPKSVLKLLECLCSPGSSDKDEKEFHSGDRVTQGLSAVWSLILLRPPIREVCLKIALQSAVHHLEEVRMKAIRLVANKLYPLPSISQQIEDFAKEMLFSAANADHTVDTTNADGSNAEILKFFILES